MKIKLFILFFPAICLESYCQPNAVLTKYLRDSINIIEARIQKEIIPTRYMAGKLLSSTDKLPNWEGTQVSEYKYSVDKGKLTAKVYLANADAKKMAAWVITTCYSITKTLKRKHTDFLINSIKDASGGQFPVKGIVYENMDGNGFKAYNFLDGVTVFLKAPGDITEENLSRAGKYARIISTTREEYNQRFPNVKTDGLAWLDVVRNEYQKALKSDTNNLMIAWAVGKLK